MIWFLFKGLIRDRSRSLFPLIVVLVGVTLTVVLHCWIQGMLSNLVSSSAAFASGHLKVTSRAYAALAEQAPNDLALDGVTGLLEQLRREQPDLVWTPRIKFGGLLDIPDEHGETRAQGPVVGLGVDLLGTDSPERGILNLDQALVSGRLPQRPGEVVISHELAERLGVRLGETATLISATMYGSMATVNFTIVGTNRFGIGVMDRGAMLADVGDVQSALDMQDAAGEIFGLFRDDIYRPEMAEGIAAAFNAGYADSDGEFTPEMLTLRGQGGLGELLDQYRGFAVIALTIFVAVMSIILWNAGLMGSLRRYGEIGMRLAMGEAKGHLYRMMIAESVMIGCIGSVIGTGLGLAVAYYLQTYGIDISSMMKNASMVMSSVLRARVTPGSFLIGLVPGLAATILGTSVSGIGIYRRQTAQLAKELET